MSDDQERPANHELPRQENSDTPVISAIDIGGLTSALTNVFTRLASIGTLGAPVRDVPLFSGEDPEQDIGQWIETIEQVCDEQQLTESQKLDFARDKLQRAASDWYFSLQRELNTWENFVDKIIQTFSVRVSIITKLDKMRKRVRSVDESVSAYVMSKFRLCTDCGLPEQDTLEEIFIGLRPVDLSEYVALSRPKSLNDLLDVIRYRERVTICPKSSSRSSIMNQTGPFANSSLDGREAATAISKVTCFGCGQKGHYRRDCPSNNSRWNQRNNQQLIRHPSSSGGLSGHKIDVRINFITVQALVDTGCTHSTITVETARKANVAYSKSDVRVSGFGSFQSLPVAGRGDVNLELVTVKHRCPILIVENKHQPYDMVLGLDVLDCGKFVWSGGSGEIKITPNRKPVSRMLPQLTTIASPEMREMDQPCRQQSVMFSSVGQDQSLFQTFVRSDLQIGESISHLADQILATAVAVNEIDSFNGFDDSGKNRLTNLIENKDALAEEAKFNEKMDEVAENVSKDAEEVDHLASSKIGEFEIAKINPENSYHNFAESTMDTSLESMIYKGGSDNQKEDDSERYRDDQMQHHTPALHKLDSIEESLVSDFDAEIPYEHDCSQINAEDPITEHNYIDLKSRTLVNSDTSSIKPELPSGMEMKPNLLSGKLNSVIVNDPYRSVFYTKMSELNFKRNEVSNGSVDAVNKESDLELKKEEKKPLAGDNLVTSDQDSTYPSLSEQTHINSSGITANIVVGKQRPSNEEDKELIKEADIQRRERARRFPQRYGDFIT